MAMTLRLSDSDTERLRTQAAAEAKSMQEVAVHALRQYLDRKSQTEVVDAAMDDVMSRYASTLRRLGE